MTRSCYSDHVVRFGLFELNLTTGELHKQGLRVKLRQQASQLLCMLLEQSGRIYTRQELQQQLWPDVRYGDLDRRLNKVIHDIRRALRDSAADAHYLETLPHHGYRFIGKSQDEPSEKVSRHRKINAIAVLRFANSNSDETGEVLADDIMQKLTDSLSRMHSVHVLAQGTVERCRSTELLPHAIGQELQVRAVVAGKISRRGNHALIHAELIDTAAGTQLWGRQFQAEWSEAPSQTEKIVAAMCADLAHLLCTGKKAPDAVPAAVAPGCAA